MLAGSCPCRSCSAPGGRCRREGFIEVHDEQTGLEDDRGPWEGPPITIVHGYDRYWAGFVGSPIQLPAIQHPRVRQAANAAISAQARLDEIHALRHSRVEQYAGLIRTGTADDIIRFEAESKILEGRDLPQAQEAVDSALQAFAATFHTTFGELRTHIQQELLPSAVRAATASVASALRDLQRLQELEDAHSGAGVRRIDEHDSTAVEDRYRREERRGVLHGHSGLGDLVQAYAAAMTPPAPAPEVESAAEPEIDFVEPGSDAGWAVRNRALHGMPNRPVA
jgi:hypothetical protein